MDSRASALSPLNGVAYATGPPALESRDLGYAVISTPTQLHGDTATWLIERGIHLPIENQSAPDSAAAARTEQIGSTEDFIAGVGHIERFNPALREALRRIASGQLGTAHQGAT